MMTVNQESCLFFQLRFNRRKRTFHQPDTLMALCAHQVMAVFLSPAIKKNPFRRSFLFNQAIFRKLFKVAVHRRKRQCREAPLQTLKNLFGRYRTICRRNLFQDGSAALCIFHEQPLLSGLPFPSLYRFI